MNNLHRTLLASLVLALAACADQHHADHPHPHEDDAAHVPGAAERHDDEHAHPHGDEDDANARLDAGDSELAGGEQEGEHGHGGGISVTHYSEATELFVEFPPLVQGEEAAFAAHLTRLSDFKAVDAGTLVVTLGGGGSPDERVEVGVSNMAGIFRPVLTPRYAGKRRLTFTLSGEGLDTTHDLGEVDVYANAAAAAAALPAEEEGSGIGFTKEQQWKIDFANASITERTIRESVAVTATIKPRATGEVLLTAPADGLLRPGPAGIPHVGMRVTSGQILGYLVPRLGGDSDLATLDLAVQRAGLDIEHARRDRLRLEQLFEDGAIPEHKLNEARNRERLAAAELDAARRRVETYQEGSNGLPLKAPTDGTIVAVGTAAGVAVAEGDMLVHIADLERLWLEARIAESDIGRVVAPQGVYFRLDGDEKATVLEHGKNAKLIAYGDLVDPETRTVPVIFEFDNADSRLKAGMHLRAMLYTGRSATGVAIPASALVDDNGQDVTFVQTEGESFERRVVTLGARDGDWIAVRSGVNAGERVVTVGGYQVRLAAVAPAALGHGHAH